MIRAAKTKAPTAKAFRVAQQLAAKAVADFAVGAGSHGEDRIAHISTVHATLEASDAGAHDATLRRQLRAFIDAHATDRAEAVQISDIVSGLKGAVIDPAYLYGVAVGLALANPDGTS